MKQIAYFSILLLLFMLHAQCDKADHVQGKTSAIKDGVVWNAKPNCRDSYLNDQLLDFGSQVLNTEGYLREELGFASVPKERAVYRLAEFDPTTFGGTGRKQCTVTYGTYVSGGDLAEGLWTVAPNDTVSYLEITDVSDKTLEGKFAVTLLLTADSKMLYPYLKDTIIFTDGHFLTEIED